MLSIIIPAYNESKTIQAILKKVIAIQLPKKESFEIIVVNDASKDNTSKLAASFLKKNNVPYTIINNKHNLGKTQTVKKGILASSGDTVVIQDADLEYDPEDIVFLYENMRRFDMDVAYGNRFGRDNGMIYIKNFYGNLFLSFISNLFTIHKTRVSIPDMEVCYKMANGDVMREIAQTITSKSNFGFEPEVTAKLSNYKKDDGTNLKFICLPISYYPRTIEEGKKMSPYKDGIKALIEIIRFNITKS